MISWLLSLLPKLPPTADLPPIVVSESGWLEGDSVRHVPSHPSWYYPRLATPGSAPLAIVAHASATAAGTAISMARRRSVPRRPDDRPASWHLSIEADGSIVQQASCEVGCWHAIGQIKGCGPANRVSVGIELIGFEKGPWPAAQVDGARRVWRAIAQSYGIRRGLAMVPHSVIDPARRSDPGRVWMDGCADAVLAYAYAR